MLLGIPGDNTYSNLAEAQRTFWRSTVLPLVERIASGLSNWLAPAYARSLELRPDLDNLPALAIERESLWASLEKTSFLTTDEKRALAGFSPAPADQKFNPGQLRIPAGNPDGGKWTTGDGGDGDLVHPIARRPRRHNNPPRNSPTHPRDHNNPPEPLLPILPPGGSGPERARLIDESGQAAPRGFSNLEDLNSFRDRLAEELPEGVSAVMQGSSVERGGSRFRDNAQGDQQASDFDVSLTGSDLFDIAALRLPRMTKTDTCFSAFIPLRLGQPSDVIRESAIRLAVRVSLGG